VSRRIPHATISDHPDRLESETKLLLRDHLNEAIHFGEPASNPSHAYV
jgi:hypothetical protein